MEAFSLDALKKQWTAYLAYFDGAYFLNTSVWAQQKSALEHCLGLLDRVSREGAESEYKADASSPTLKAFKDARERLKSCPNRTPLQRWWWFVSRPLVYALCVWKAWRAGISWRAAYQQGVWSVDSWLAPFVEFLGEKTMEPIDKMRGIKTYPFFHEPNLHPYVFDPEVPLEEKLYPPYTTSGGDPKKDWFMVIETFSTTDRRDREKRQRRMMVPDFPESGKDSPFFAWTANAVCGVIPSDQLNKQFPVVQTEWEIWPGHLTGLNPERVQLPVSVFQPKTGYRRYMGGESADTVEARFGGGHFLSRLQDHISSHPATHSFWYRGGKMESNEKDEKRIGTYPRSPQAIDWLSLKEMKERTAFLLQLSTNPAQAIRCAISDLQTAKFTDPGILYKKPRDLLFVSGRLAFYMHHIQQYASHPLKEGELLEYKQFWVNDWFDAWFEYYYSRIYSKSEYFGSGRTDYRDYDKHVGTVWDAFAYGWRLIHPDRERRDRLLNVFAHHVFLILQFLKDRVIPFTYADACLLREIQKDPEKCAALQQGLMEQFNGIIHKLSDHYLESCPQLQETSSLIQSAIFHFFPVTAGLRGTHAWLKDRPYAFHCFVGDRHSELLALEEALRAVAGTEYRIGPGGKKRFGRMSAPDGSYVGWMAPHLRAASFYVLALKYWLPLAEQDVQWSLYNPLERGKYNLFWAALDKAEELLHGLDEQHPDLQVVRQTRNVFLELEQKRIAALSAGFDVERLRTIHKELMKERNNQGESWFASYDRKRRIDFQTTLNPCRYNGIRGILVGYLFVLQQNGASKAELLKQAPMLYKKLIQGTVHQPSQRLSEQKIREYVSGLWDESESEFAQGGLYGKPDVDEKQTEAQSKCAHFDGSDAVFLDPVQKKLFAFYQAECTEAAMDSRTAEVMDIKTWLDKQAPPGVQWDKYAWEEGVRAEIWAEAWVLSHLLGMGVEIYYKGSSLVRDSHTGDWIYRTVCCVIPGPRGQRAGNSAVIQLYWEDSKSGRGTYRRPTEVEKRGCKKKTTIRPVETSYFSAVVPYRSSGGARNRSVSPEPAADRKWAVYR